MDQVQTIRVAKFLFKKEFSSLSNALNAEPAYDVVELADSAQTAFKSLSEEQATLVIVSLNSKEDLIQLTYLVKESKKANLIVKFVVSTALGAKFDKAISKLGIMDYLEATMTSKALRYKVDFWIKSLRVQLKKTVVEDPSIKKKTVSEQEAQAKKKNTEMELTWAPPMDCVEDIWLVRPEDVRKVMGKYLVRAKGPSPYVARWVESSRPGHFEFKFKSEVNDYCSKEAVWYFKGAQKPDFVWKENIWMITGDNYDLFCEVDGQVISRMSLKNKVLTVSEISEYAKTKEGIIVESFDRSLVSGGEGLEDEEAAFDEDGSNRFKNLEGKNKTDHIEAGPLSGKAKTEHQEGAPLSGKSQTDQLSGPLSGKQKTTDHIDSGPLSGEVETDDVTAPLLAMGLEDGEQDLSDDPLSMEADQQIADSKPLVEKKKTEHIATHYGNEIEPEEAIESEELELGSLTEHIDTHYSSPKSDEQPKESKQAAREAMIEERRQELIAKIEEIKKKEAAQLEIAKKNKEDRDLRAKEEKKARPDLQVTEDEDSIDLEDLAMSVEDEQSPLVSHSTDKASSKTISSSNTSATGGKSNVVDFDYHKGLKAYFDKAARQYKQG